VGTARGIAQAYSAFAAEGGPLQLSAKTLQALSAPATPPTLGDFDECMKVHGIRYSLGFMKPGDAIPFGSDAAFGSPGAGGAMGFADPKTGIAYAYVTSQGGATLTGDPRDVALRAAVYSSLSAA